MDAIRITKVTALLEKGRSTVRVPVHLHFTPNHLLIVPDTSDAAEWGSLEGQKALAGELWIPYPTVHSIERKFPTPDGLHPIHIVCRNFVFVRMFVDVEQDALEAYGTLQKLINITSIESLFAFSYRNTSPSVSSSSANIWCPYIPEREFARMGVGTRTGEWRLSTVNQEYQLCPTYSRVIVVPTKVSDAVLTYAARFRSKGRLPTLSYIHRKGNISLTRSAQPLAGITANRSPQDERLVQSIFATGSPSLPRDREHLIVDARPTVNALAQGVFNGAGMENTENYGKCRMEFLGIDNIHVMRDSHHRMLDALDEARHPSPPPSFGRTNWLKHLRHILSGAVSLIGSMHIHQLHVLVHCSDGWDRTAQLCSLAMLCLDPYYRTLEGFAVLIEKEWVATGHKFSARLGHLSKEGNVWNPAEPHQPTATAHVANRKFLHAKEVSPVFLQFLDCTYQIWRQFPTDFEFGEAYLAELATAAYSCQFGNFLFDSERERNEFRSSGGKTLQEVTESVWAHLERNRERFLNPIY
ncbi:phosphatases II, partial [Gonapodya prolifera JEL478]